MLTYASGRYPVPGADGETYDAQYEPVLQTKVYPGGKNKKAHFGLFSEKMPEMVVSGPTTKIIQENYPEIMDAILTVEKHGRLKYSMPVFADGSYPYAGGAESAAYRQEENGVFVPVENNRMSDALEMMERTIAALNDTLVSGKIKTRIDMYGKGGVKESMDKADTVYRRNNIKSGK